MTGIVLEVTELTDPGCIWSWASEPAMRWLRLALGERAQWRRVFGVQLNDLAVVQPDYATAEVAEEYRIAWLATALQTGAPAPERTSRMHRSTRPACLAAKAAEAQGATVADAVLRRLREAFFVEGSPPDDEASIAAAVYGVVELDSEKLLSDYSSAAVQTAIEEDFLATRQLPSAVASAELSVRPVDGLRRDGDFVRYGFPTLDLRGPGGRAVVSGWHTIAEYGQALQAVDPKGDGPRFERLPVAELLSHFGTLTLPEVELLSVEREPPPGSVMHPSANGPLFADQFEAQRRGWETERPFVGTCPK